MTGEVLPGVNVTVEGTQLGASTDVDGFYVILNVPVGIQNIKLNYAGYTEYNIQNVQVFTANTTDVNVELEEEVNVGDVVVVIAKRAEIRQEETNSRQVREIVGLSSWSC